MLIIAISGMAAALLLAVSAGIKFGWLGALHVILTIIAVGLWSAAAFDLQEEDSCNEDD